MKPITQKECLKILEKTPFTREGGSHRFVLRFMFNLNKLSKSRGYRLFNFMDYAIKDEDIIGSWIISNVEPLSKEIIEKKIRNSEGSSK